MTHIYHVLGNTWTMVKQPIISHLPVLVLLLALGCIWPTHIEGKQRSAQSLKNEASKLYWGREVAQDLSRALGLYESAAAMGDTEASYIAGGMYYTGKGTLKDPIKAFKYLNYAASKGKSSPDSQRALAKFYLQGDGVPQNYSKAVQWYEEAAADGDSKSQIELGFLYFVGRGVGQDFTKAFEWFREAAVQNNNMAQYNMGIMWYTGNGVPESDLKKAYAWFSIAASNKFAEAITARDFLRSEMSEKELVVAQNMAEAIYLELQEEAPLNADKR